MAWKEGRALLIAPESLLRHVGWMRALARSLLGDDGLAEDAVQETFLAAVRRPPRQEAAAGAWLRTALCRFASLIRSQETQRHRREIRAARPESLSQEPDRLLERVEVHRQLVDEVLGLADPLRSTVLLRYFEGLGLAEIARRHGVDESTVRWRLKTALGRLRTRLAERHDGPGAWQVAVAPLLGPSIRGLPGPALETGRAAGSGTAWQPLSGIWRNMVSSLAGVALMKLRSVVVAAILSLCLAGFLFHQLSVNTADRLAAPSLPVPAAPAGGEPASAIPVAQSNDPPPSPLALETPPEPSPPAASVTGLVTSADTGAVLPAALVLERGSDRESICDAQGEYVLEALPPGEHFLVARAPGHAERHARVRLASPEVFRQDFRLDPALDLRVTVVDTGGQPLEGVEVTPAQPNRDYVHDDVYTRRTGTDGTVVLSGINRNDPQQVNARKAGYAEVWTGDYRVPPGEDRAELRIVLEPRPLLESVVIGKVTGPGGQALEGVQVQWIHSHGEHKGREVAMTGRAGGYRLSFPSEKDRVTISACREGLAPRIQQDIQPGTAQEPAIVDFEMEGAHWLEGAVFDEEGKPVEKATVNAMPSLGTLRNSTLYPGILRTAATDAAGRFRLGDLSGPVVAIQLRGPGGAEWAHNMNEEVEVDREVRLTLERWKVLRGRVKDVDGGEPITAFTVKLKKGAGYYDYKRCDPGESFQSAEGRFLLERLDPDPFTFTVEAEGYMQASIEDARTHPPDSAEVVTVEMTRGTELEGRVVDRATSLPIPQASVDYGLWERDELAWDRYALENMRNVQQTVTGPDGAFTFVEAEAGTLFVRARGYGRLAIGPEARKLLTDGTGKIVVQLQAGATLSGVLYQEGKPCRTGFLVLARVVDTPPGKKPGGREWMGGLERDDSGHFREEGLVPGSYVLGHYREAPGGRTAGMGIHRAVEVQGDEETRVELGKDYGDVVYAGRVIDLAGKPLDNVHLELEPAFEWSYTLFRSYVKASHDGRFYFEGLRPGVYRVRVTGPQDRSTSLPAVELRTSAENETVVVRGI